MIVRVALWQMAPTSVRKAELGHPSTADAAKGHAQQVQRA